MKNTSIIVGPPGTGKTTELLNLINSYLHKGIAPNKIGFVSFTKKSVDEAKTRAAIKFNKPINYFNFFRTIHSLAFYQLSLSKTSVIEWSHYKEIGDLLGITIKGKNVQDVGIDELDKGDQLVFIESLARMRCEDIEVTYNRELLDFSIQELRLFKATYEKYKKVHMLYDFTDMLTRFNSSGIMPKLDVLLVDEAQDLCAIQWKIIERMAENSEKTFIAGDDDQAIFRWSGADIEYFVGLAKTHETKVLSQSFRVPHVVHKLANDLIEDVSFRVSKEYHPTVEEGKIDWVSGIEEIDLEKGEWLILVRNIFMINKIVDYLRINGYTYMSKFKSSNDNPALKAAMDWEKLRKGEKLTTSNINEVLSYMSNKRALNKVVKQKDDILLNLTEVRKQVKFVKEPCIWYEMLDKISVEDREYFIAVRRRGGSFLTTPRITVSTIHGAKGGEGENVILFTDLSLKTYNKMLENYEDEVRVFYVGITRAKKNLYIVQNNSNCYFSI